MTRDELIALAEKHGGFRILSGELSFDDDALEAFAAALSSATPAGGGLTDRSKVAILGTFAHEAFMGAIRPSELEHSARRALMRTGLLNLDSVTALAASPVPMSDTGAQDGWHDEKLPQHGLMPFSFAGLSEHAREAAREYAEEYARKALKEASPPPQSAPQDASKVEQLTTSVTIDFKQATDLLAMFGGEPTEITLMTGNGHSGEGLYAVYNADPEGAVYLGETDEEAAPVPQASQSAGAQDCGCIRGTKECKNHPASPPPQSAPEGFMPKAEYAERVKKWRDFGDGMHQRAMKAEAALKASQSAPDEAVSVDVDAMLPVDAVFGNVSFKAGSCRWRDLIALQHFMYQATTHSAPVVDKSPVSGMTDEEIQRVADHLDTTNSEWSWKDFARAIEAALREKDGGKA